MIKVLIVEDDPMVASINTRFLERVEGFVLTAVVASIADAKQMMMEQHPDLILLDLFLPRENGMDFLKWIRAEGLSADVILITADKTSTMIQGALRYGAIDYLIKPFTFDRLREALNRYRQRRLNMAQKQTVTQQELDQMLLAAQADPEDSDMEKGINKYTYRLICKVLNQPGNQYYSAEEISELSGVATVTVRRYLNFMERGAQIEKLVEYGKVGRPQHKYRIISTSHPSDSTVF